MLEALLVVGQQIRIVAPQLVGAQKQLGEIHEPATLADFLVGGIERDHLPAVRVPLVVEVLRPQALVLLRIDEPLDLLGHPAAVVDLEILQQPLDQPQLVVRIDDLEVLRQLRFLPVPPQQAMRQAVKRADPQVTDRHAEQRLDPAAHLGRRLVGECDREQALRRHALDVDQPGGPVHQDARLAAAGAGDDQRRLGGRRDGLALRIVEGFENRGDVHEARKFSRIARVFGTSNPGARRSPASSGRGRTGCAYRSTRTRRSGPPG